MAVPLVPDMHWIGARVRLLRRAQRLSTRELARRAGLPSHATIMELEQGSNVRVMTLLRTLQGLGVSAQTFFSDAPFADIPYTPN